MEFSIEQLYELVGRDDKVAVVDLIAGSEGYQKFGPSITVVLLYNQPERDVLERHFRKGRSRHTHGKVKMEFLSGARLTKEQKETLRVDGINSQDIKTVFTGGIRQNLYYEDSTRQIHTIEIPITSESNGGDYDWMYGFKKMMVNKGYGLDPYARESYLAWKLFFEEASLTKDELDEMYDDDILKPGIELKYLEVKLERGVISAEEEKKYVVLLKNFMSDNYTILRNELNGTGVSIHQLAKKKPQLALYLIKGISDYIPRQLNITGRKAIYLDWRGFLHVFIRHVKEFEMGERLKDKTKFLWAPDDIIPVMSNVIGFVNEEIQEFWEQNPNERFSKFRHEALYYEGDYYTFHIEASGRLSTFHGTTKKYKSNIESGS